MPEPTEAPISTAGGDCYGCHQRTGQRCHHEVVFADSRTGRSFCHECVEALVTWEFDGSPEPDDHPYPEWIGVREAEPLGQWTQDAKGFWTFDGGEGTDA